MPEYNRDRGSNSLMSALFGAALGAAAVYLSDRGNRRKVKRKVDQLRYEGEDMVDRVKEKVDEGKEKARHEYDKLQDKMDS